MKGQQLVIVRHTNTDVSTKTTLLRREQSVRAPVEQKRCCSCAITRPWKPQKSLATCNSSGWVHCPPAIHPHFVKTTIQPFSPLHKLLLEQTFVNQDYPQFKQHSSSNQATASPSSFPESVHVLCKQQRRRNAVVLTELQLTGEKNGGKVPPTLIKVDTETPKWVQLFLRG